MTVHVGDAPLSAYAPAVSQPHNVFTISATAMPKGTTPPAPQLRTGRNGIVVTAPNPLAALLVRVPKESISSSIRSAATSTSPTSAETRG